MRCCRSNTAKDHPRLARKSSIHWGATAYVQCLNSATLVLVSSGDRYSVKKTRKRLAFAAGMITSAVFLALALRGLHPDQFWSSLAELNPPLLLVAVLVYFAAVGVIALRWQFLLRAIKYVPLPALTKLVFIGYMGNNVYLLRAGDALRIILLRRNYQVPLVLSTTIVALERMFDGCVMLSFVLLSLLLIDVESAEVTAIVSISAPLFAIALIFALALAAKPNLLRSALSPAMRLLPRQLGGTLSNFAEEILAGLEGLRSQRHLLGAVISSYLTWAVEAGAYWIVMRAFELDLSYAVALLVVGAVNLAGLIPASPGQVGVNEFVVISILTALGIAAPLATAYAVVVHLTIWLPITLAGFILLLKQGLGWADIGMARELEIAEA